MKSILFGCLVTLSVTAIQAQEATPGVWKKSIQAGLNYNQSSFSDGWKGGGVNSLSWNGLLNAKSEYKHSRFTWTNDFQSQYGQTNAKGLGTRKSVDRIFFESKANHNLDGKWGAFGAASVLTQFADGRFYGTKADGSDSSTLISGFLAPAYITEALGLEYKPVPFFSAQFGFISFRQTLVIDQRVYDTVNTRSNVLYGVAKGDNIRNQFGFQFIGTFDKEIMKNITLKARYQLLADYMQLNKKGMVSRLDLNLLAKINKYISFSFGVVHLYDYAQVDRAQFSQVMGIGIIYSASNFEKQ